MQVELHALFLKTPFPRLLALTHLLLLKQAAQTHTYPVFVVVVLGVRLLGPTRAVYQSIA